MSYECIYCGSKEDLTKDHIPPKNLFPKPRPSNLMTVPCCNDCNGSFSLDDEYIQVMFSIRIDVHKKDTIQKNWNKVLRGLKRKESAGFYKSIMSSIKKIDVKTKDGLYLGKISTYDIDMKRINNISDRVIQGLYYKITGNRVPMGYDYFSTIYLVDDISEQSEKAFQMFIDTLATENNYKVGEVFSYRYKKMDFDSNAYIFYFSIYENFDFFGMVSKED